jgi:hypothetical protein
MTGKLTYQRNAETGETTVLLDGDRLGVVRNVSLGKWAATDTYFVDLPRSHSTRKAAVDALLRRKADRA